MRKALLFFASFFILSAAIAQSTESANGPEITFEEKSHDFGDISQGDVVEHVFKFENTGKQPLIISNVKTTCGCTVPSYPRGEAIAPGETGEITVKFNSRGKMGRQNKIVRIVSNIGEERSVRITTNVLPKDS
ncbi:DUF1573 domain-containing protein [Marivirga arenosa]|uniref:DUF1573 domain-containing protein n=1 Tax=Marivirga arenosa TaxID=3059076 RepID=A0AA49GK90_9BACT|nr:MULTISPECIES: DUF1573 domain-containing protein [unclassified Marivirga]WKK81153.1 DUF1573 domain-containing protein [Marivirga sp. BKB1-2]WKK83859.1 DUF1573 domain-containing protein [Marivirga sp. ABR2-2]